VPIEFFRHVQLFVSVLHSMFIAHKPDGLQWWNVDATARNSALSENVVRDLDLWTHDLENVSCVMWTWQWV